MLFIGDVHNELERYEGIAQEALESLQVGDMGIFNREDVETYNSLGICPSQHKFIRGNHDNPDLCRSLMGYLADLTYIEAMDMLVVAGGLSVDAHMRTEGVNYWANEELPWQYLYDAVDMARTLKPKYIVTHECPNFLISRVSTNPLKHNANSRTSMALENIAETAPPELWIFGHHHKRVQFKEGPTEYVGLGELKRDHYDNCVFEVKSLSWDN